MSKEMITYLKEVADATIQHMLTVQPYEPAISVDFGAAARVYLANIGFVLANRPDLIEDSELRTKLGFSERPQWPKQPETTPEQEQIKSEEEGEVTLDPRIDVEELRVLLVREVLQATRLNDTDAREFADYLMEMGQFKSALNISIDAVFVSRKQLLDYLVSPLGEALQYTFRIMPMNEVLQKWVTERTADFKELLPEEKEKFDEEIQNVLMKTLTRFVPEDNSRQDFVKFVSEHPLFLEMMVLTAEIPVLTHFGQRRKTLQETVQATSHKLPVNQLFWEWRQSLNETPANPIQSPPEAPNKTERGYDFLNLSFFKSAVTTPQSGPTERYSKEEAASRLVEVVGIPSQTANVIAEELLRQFSQQELKKGFESTLEVQRLFWLWVRSKYSVELFKRLSHIEVHEVKVWIHRLLSTKEACLCAINSGLRIQNLTFLDLIYLLLRSGFEVIPYGFHGDLQSLLNKFNFDALLDTWKRGVEVY